MDPSSELWQNNWPRQHLLALARCARENAVAPFSKFMVGAAIETANGLIFTGCNIENATYGLTICAERCALFNALSQGHREFIRIAIAANTKEPTPPCGACRQLLWEFGGDLEVIVGDLSEETALYRLKDLFPHPFDVRSLESS